MRFVGDVHGKYDRYKAILHDGKPTIQVGDMGVGFRRLGGPRDGEFDRNPPYDLMVEGGHRFIRGNHDNPSVCRAHTQCIQDGTIENGVMFIGGAVSIDRAWRKEGYSWWADEELSQEELDKLIEKYIAAKPKVMVTHDAPEEVALEVFRSIPVIGKSANNYKFDPEHASRTRAALQRMLSAHSPDIWVFGHWHVPFDHVLNGTRFMCLAELEYKDIDI